MFVLLVVVPLWCFGGWRPPLLYDSMSSAVYREQLFLDSIGPNYPYNLYTGVV